MKNGGRYRFSFIGISKKRILVVFSFFRRLMAPGAKLSGRGYAIIQVAPSNEERK